MNRHLRRTFTRQLELSDCGIACLLSVLRYYEGESNFEALRRLSGTTPQGTTLLGLFQAAPALGLQAAAVRTSLENLQKTENPLILPVQIENRQHYIVLYSFSEKGFLIGDPAEGLRYISTQELEKIWQNQQALRLFPNETFVRKQTLRTQQWAWLWQVIENDTVVLGIGLFLGIVLSGLGLASSVFMQKLIDDFLPNRLSEKLVAALVFLFLLLLAKNGLQFLRSLLMLRQGLGFNSRLISAFFQKILYLPKLFFDSRKSGELLTRLNDTQRIQQTVAYLAGNWLIDVLLFVVAFVFLLFYHVQIAFFLFLSTSIFFLIAFLFEKSIRQEQQANMRTYAEYQSKYLNTLHLIETIKTANQEPFFGKILSHSYQQYQEKSAKLGLLSLRIGFWIELSATLILAILLAFGSYEVLENQLKIGELVAIFSMANLMLPAANRIAFTHIQISGAKVAFERMYELASSPPEYEFNPTQTLPYWEGFSSDVGVSFPLPIGEGVRGLTIKNLSFRFAGRSLLFKDFSLEIRAGEKVALLGESGKGKSTLLQILAKLYPYSEGEILVNGQNLHEIPHSVWRNVVSFMPQETKLLNATLLENIGLDTSQDYAKIIAFCQETGFSRYFEALPQGYFTLLGEEGINLSGGQKQLVGLARVLFRKPQLLLLDEPTSGMDIETEKQIWAILRNLPLTILFSTHRLSLTEGCRIYRV